MSPHFFRVKKERKIVGESRKVFLVGSFSENCSSSQRRNTTSRVLFWSQLLQQNKVKSVVEDFLLLSIFGRSLTFFRSFCSTIIIIIILNIINGKLIPEYATKTAEIEIPPLFTLSPFSIFQGLFRTLRCCCSQRVFNAELLPTPKSSNS